MGPLVLPLIAAGSSLAGQAINAGSQSATNQSQLSYSREMYDKQRADALADWNMQNQYNSPKEQMMRFKEAGLNPNLIYGQGNSGNQSSPASYQAPRLNYQFDPFDMPQVLQPFQDYQMRAAQIDNVKASTESTRTEIGNKLLSRLLMSTNTARKDFDLQQARKLAPFNATIRKGEADATFTKLLREFEKTTGQQIQNALNSSRRELVDRQWEGQGLQNYFNQHRNIFIRRGITTADNPLVRIMYMMMHNTDMTFNQSKMRRDLGIKD